MPDPIPVPVPILRLPRGPDSSGTRGFSAPRHNRDIGDNPRDTGDNPRDIGDNPLDNRDNPLDTGDNPRDTGDNPRDTGDNPRDTGDNPLDTGDNPRDTGDNPRDNRDNRDNPSVPRRPACAGAVQRLRASLRERFLLLLARARARPVRFEFRGGLGLRARFGAADVQSGALQVDSLQTPLGIQRSALLRCGDILEFSFPLE